MTMVAANPDRSAKASAGVLKSVRHGLDAAYAWSGYVAAAFMLAILVLTILQVVTRYLHVSVSGLSEYAGYVMAASTFLALAHALNSGTHIRIETFAKLLGRHRIWLDIWALGVTAVIASWFAYYSCSMVWWSIKFNDVSTGLDATPLWIPQSAMALGSVMFAVALADNFVQLLFTGKHSIQKSTEVL